QRKQMFMSLMKPASIEEICDLAERHWHEAAKNWQELQQVNFFDQLQEILFKAICEWSGIPLSDVDVTQRTREIALMIDGAGSVGPRNWRGAFHRQRSEAWLRELVVEV